MNSTYLIQRLNKPQNFINPFSFGVGFKNGGLSDKAAEIIKGIWSFDYMGSAEFEFGAIPKSLREISIYSHENKAEIGEIRLQKPVFYFCKGDIKEDTEKIIRELAKDKLWLKQPSFFSEVLNNENPQYYRTKGWLELDNNFMFFVDKEMYEKTLKLFGVD